MAFDAHKNFAVSTVATAPSPAASGTSLVVAAATGTRFPAVSFNATVRPNDGSMPTPANSEIVRVTTIATDTFTITRIQESSSARTIVVGDIIEAAITAKTVTDVEAAVAFIAPRVTSITSSATPTPNADTTDCYDVTALATAPTFAAPTGTPVNFQRLLIRIKDNATLRALAWNASYVAGGAALPTTTVTSKILNIMFIYNTANSLNKWQCVATAQEV